MHVSSFAKMASFFTAYRNQFPSKDGTTRLLDVGSRVFLGQKSYRELVRDERIRYIGLDLEAGNNVDLVAESGFVWSELADESIDVCISGQTFEHNPFFWATMAEISRVLVPNGLTCIIAPGAQGIHQFPVDCWRFYPDSWAALCALTGLEVLETYFETDEMALKVIDGHNRDSMVIARKPREPDPALERRLELLTRPFREHSFEIKALGKREGPCIADYRRTAPRAKHWRALLSQFIYPYGPVRLFNNSDRH